VAPDLAPQTPRRESVTHPPLLLIPYPFNTLPLFPDRIRIQDGDSGSWAVDTSGITVYGMVVASLSDMVYVLPLRDVRVNGRGVELAGDDEIKAERQRRQQQQQRWGYSPPLEPEPEPQPEKRKPVPSPPAELSELERQMQLAARVLAESKQVYAAAREVHDVRSAAQQQSGSEEAGRAPPRERRAPRRER
jgi:hypothetical protein